MTTYRVFPFPLLLVLALPFAACDSTEPDPGAGEEELITRVVLTLEGGGETITAEADDPDGDGANIQVDPLTLQAGTTYDGSIQLFDDINNENITEEVEEEAEEHQFFYTAEGGIADRVTIAIDDEDANGLPIGLSFTLTVSEGGTASGTLNVVLSHYDEEPKDGINRSDETDVDIDFPVTIQ